MDIAIKVLTLIGVGSGIIYIIGGIIVQLYLSSIGIQDLQILKTRYLIAGISFILFLSLIIFFVLFVSDQLVGIEYIYSSQKKIQVIIMILVITSWFIALFYSVIRINKNMKNLEFLIIGGFLTFLPIYLTLHNNPLFSGDSLPLRLLVYFGSAMIIIFNYVGVYAGFVSTPSLVKLSIDNQIISSMNALGLPTNEKGVTNAIYLIDESNDFYLLSIGNIPKGRIIEVRKNVIKAMIWENQGSKKKQMPF